MDPLWAYIPKYDGVEDENAEELEKLQMGLIESSRLRVQANQKVRGVSKKC